MRLKRIDNIDMLSTFLVRREKLASLYSKWIYRNHLIHKSGQGFMILVWKICDFPQFFPFLTILPNLIIWSWISPDPGNGYFNTSEIHILRKMSIFAFWGNKQRPKIPVFAILSIFKGFDGKMTIYPAKWPITSFDYGANQSTDQNANLS